MTGKRIRAAVFAFVFVILCSTSAFAVPFKLPNIDLQASKKAKHPKMESVLSDLFKEHKKGKAAAEAFAKKRGLTIEDEESVTVFLLLEEKKTIKDIDTDHLFDLGVDIIKSYGNVIQANIPLDSIEIVADAVPGINFIKFPDKPHAQTITEGLNLTGAATYQTAGYTGNGVKLAVIDWGFKDLTAAINAGELPNTLIVVDCTGSGCVSVYPWDLSETEDHGTAVAEIVHDMAPNAQLYLIKAKNTVDLAYAKNWCISQGVKIINYSVGWWNQNFYSGECYNSNPVCTVNNAYANGILWVNSSGNHAHHHYQALFADTNGNGWHNINSDIEVIQFTAQLLNPVDIYLSWNAWPVTDQDYDLFLFDSALNEIGRSDTTQSGTQPPAEYLLFIPFRTDIFYIAIKKYSASNNHKFSLFVPHHDLYPKTISNSLVSPADASGALAVGAIDYPDWLTGPIAYYSSRGPTNDGRLKPEISAPASVSTYTMGASGFPGTSAAAPHVAGAAALILSAHPSYSVSQLWNALTGSAIDMGAAGPDNVYGYGRLNMPSLVAITIGTNPSGRQITVDGNGYTAPKTFNWAKGSNHTLNISSPQSGSAGTRYIFSSWSDGGAQSHTITTPSSNATYTVNFTTQYQLTTSVNPASSGTISPICTSGCWYNSGLSITLSPTPSGDNTFLSWTGDVSSTDAPISFSLNGPKNITANFDSTAVTGKTIRLISGEALHDYYDTIPLAYEDAADKDVIQMQAISYAGTLTFERTGITVTLKGGYNETYSNNTGKTTVGSPVTVQAGTIIADNIAIQ